ncbi:putative gamma-butyrolactone autoregulator biosynthesis protein [Streptomyces sp. NBRC 110611]|uniref:ScbA/BarX family gamma-butyrolactone biosynthesis protein n=1 Tax=Streptomyces sp. NBRC 110611 TaxID=1621259 RepID=UPI00082B9424|nr:ScbA/BarX family gamma-butyrolactone biosynthesis protein [Streptomyces sp. NBRC 110611]GAU66940.1 putative gamma-butyrolactone autoregulator biosynthesis protein [Streptomyces sp. NBRC 110611]
MASATLVPPWRDQRKDGGVRFGERQSVATATVPRAYPRPAATPEAFLTNWRRGTAGSWVVSARWPRAHHFYAPVRRLHDPLLLIETIRQAGILLSHVAHRVPLDHPVIWRRVRYDLAPRAPRTDEPAEVELRVTDHDLIHRGGQLASARQEFQVRCDGADLASAVVDYSCHSPAVYRRLRGRYSDPTRADARRLPLPEAVSPRLVARNRERDVVLSPTGRPDRWRLRVDASHPVLFGHPVDHAPGMLMIEAARQAAQAVTPGVTVPTAMDCAFEGYAELDAPCWVRARTTADPAAGPADGGRQQVAVGVEQHGKPVTTARITSVPLAQQPS